MPVDQNYTNGKISGEDLASYMPEVAKTLLGERNQKLSSATEWRYGRYGSVSVNLEDGTFYDHENGVGGGVLDLIARQEHCDRATAMHWLQKRFGLEQPLTKPNGHAKPGIGTIVATYDYHDQHGQLVFQVVRYEPKTFRQRRPDPDKPGGWRWKMDGVELVPYRLPQLLAATETVYVAEGEKDCDNLAKLGLIATTNPGGVKKWRSQFARAFAGKEVVVLPDNDAAGLEHAKIVAKSLAPVAKSVVIVKLPGLPPKGDVSDWIEGRSEADLLAIVKASPAWQAKAETDGADTEDELVTEDSIAVEVALQHATEMRFVAERQKWLIWNGARWHLDHRGMVPFWCRHICRTFTIDTGKDKWGKQATSVGVEKFLRIEQPLVINLDDLDADPLMLGTPNGVVDLRTGELLPPDRKHLITKSAAVDPGTGEATEWLRFLEQATKGDREVIRYLQQMAGYALTGQVRDHALFFVFGPGGSGKGTFLNAIRGIMGTYAVHAPVETFMNGLTSRHPTELAMLQGARLVTASETEEGQAWAESKIKALTGGDPVTARFVNKDFFTFAPTFKLIIIGNHRPVLHNVDEALRRRLRMIPFIHIPDQPDPELGDKLRTEYPKILQWMIDGCVDWQAEPMSLPAIVHRETFEYFQDQDDIGMWLAERVEIDQQIDLVPDEHLRRTTSAKLFASWSNWATSNGEKPGTNKRFSEQLTRRGYRKKRSKCAVEFMGLGLISP